MNTLTKTGAPAWTVLLFLLAGLATAEPIAFVGVDVLRMDSEEVLRHQTVIVDDGRIATIGPMFDTPIPQDATRINGEGRSLMPGLTEMHAHIPSLRRGREWVDEVLFLFVANGVTTVRGMLGEPFHLELREEVRSGNTLGPRIITSGPSLNGRSVDGPDAARRMVREQAAAGYDFLKLHPGLSLAEFDAIAVTAKEVGIPFAGHVSEDVGLERTLAAGQATIDHLDGYMQALVPADAEAPSSPGFFGAALIHVVDTDRIPQLARDTRESNVANVLTQTLMDNLALPPGPDVMAERPEMRFVPPDMLASWTRAKRDAISAEGYDPADGRRFIEIRRQIIGALRDAGAPILLGSDAPQIFNVPGFSIHRELQTMVDAGLTPYEALYSGTVATAAFFGKEKEFGRIAVGMEADLILSDGNPLENVAAIRRPAGVMLRGQWLDRATLDRRLAELERKYN